MRRIGLHPLLGTALFAVQTLVAGVAGAEDAIQIGEDRIACSAHGVVAYTVQSPPITEPQTLTDAEQALEGIHLYQHMLWIIAAETSCGVTFEDVTTPINARILPTLQDFDRLANSGQTAAQINALAHGRVQQCYADLTADDLAHVPSDFASRLPCEWVPG